MWIYCGLGNPGLTYEKTRHNFGFLALTAFATKHKLNFQMNSALESELAFYRDKAILLKPMTYMNLSGRAVKKALNKYGLSPQNLLVIYDDLDLPLGRMKLLPKGGSGGHRGVQSIISELQTKEFPRLRLGIGRPEKGDPRDYVLSPFREEEWPIVESVLERVVLALEELLYHGLLKTMHKVNSGG